MGVMPKTRRLIARARHHVRDLDRRATRCAARRGRPTTRGQYAHNHGVRWNNFPQGGYYKFNGRRRCPVWLRRAGYRTIHIGKYLNEYGERNPTEVPPGWTTGTAASTPSPTTTTASRSTTTGTLKTYGAARARLLDRRLRAARRAGDPRRRGARKPFFLNLAPIAPHTVASVTARRGGHAGRAGAPARRRLRRTRRCRAIRTSTRPTSPTSRRSSTGVFAQLLPAADIEALTAALPRPDGLAAGGRRHGRARGRDAQAHGRVPQHRHHLHLRQRLDPRRAPPARPAHRGRPGDRGQVPALRGLLARAAAHRRRARLPEEADRERRGRERRPRAHDPRAHRREGRPARSTAGRWSRPRGSPSCWRAAACCWRPSRTRARPTYTSIRTQRYRYELHDGGDEGLYDLEADPWELTSFHADPRYARIKAILRSKLAVLRTCGGRNCRVDVGRLPKPG